MDGTEHLYKGGQKFCSLLLPKLELNIRISDSVNINLMIFINFWTKILFTVKKETLQSFKKNPSVFLLFLSSLLLLTFKLFLASLVLHWYMHKWLSFCSYAAVDPAVANVFAEVSFPKLYGIHVTFLLVHVQWHLQFSAGKLTHIVNREQTHIGAVYICKCCFTRNEEVPHCTAVCTVFTFSTVAGLAAAGGCCLYNSCWCWDLSSDWHPLVLHS